MNPWVQTISGQAVDLVKPDLSSVALEEVAVSLSRLARFSGHSKAFYSVAQHSVLVSQHVPPALAFAALMHDAHEAFLGDITSPVKRAIGAEVIDKIANRLDRAITKRWNVKGLGSPYVRQADLEALATEKRDLMAPQPKPWIGLPVPWSVVIIPGGMDRAYHEFMDRAYRVSR